MTISKVCDLSLIKLNKLTYAWLAIKKWSPHKGAEILECIMGIYTLSENRLKMLLRFNMWVGHLLLLKKARKGGKGLKDLQILKKRKENIRKGNSSLFRSSAKMCIISSVANAELGAYWGGSGGGRRRNTATPSKYKPAAHSFSSYVGAATCTLGHHTEPSGEVFCFSPLRPNLFRAHWSWLHSSVPISMSPSLPKCSRGLRIIYHFFFPMFPSHYSRSKIIEVTTTKTGMCHRFWQNMKCRLKATFGLWCRKALTQRQPRSKVLFGFRA